MEYSEQFGLKGLRFDTKLKSFNDILNLFLGSAKKIKQSGKRVIAKPPLCPVEPIYAAGALAYDSCTHETIYTLMKDDQSLISQAIKAGLSPDANPWNLIMAGAVISSKNEVAIDAYLVACGYWDDQIKNTWQLMAEATEAPLFFWEVPRFDPNSTKWAKEFLAKEFEQLFDWLTAQTGNRITENNLKESIRLGNLLRQDILELTQMLQLTKVPIPALEYYIAQVMIDDYAQDPKMLHDRYSALIQELKERESQEIATTGISKKPVRIYFMGDEPPDLRIWNTIETCGGVIVGCDTRLSLYYEMIREEGSIIDNLAHWILRMPSNLPIADRIKKTIPFIEQQKPDALIISSLVGSKLIPESEMYVREIIEDELAIPVLSLEITHQFDKNESIEKQVLAFIKKYAG